MPKGYWVVLGTTALLSGCATAPIDTPPFEHYTLANGMEVLIWPNSNSESSDEVSMEFVVKAGSEDELPHQAGLAHFVEHMAFEQRDVAGNNPIDAWLSGLSLEHQSHANAYTTFDRTRYFVHFDNAAAERLQTGVDLFAHIATQTDFNEAEVEQEKAVIKAEWRYRENTETANDMLAKVDLEEHPWHDHFPIGSMDVVSGATAQQLSDFYHTHYRPDNAFLVVTGDVDVSSLKHQISEAFSGWPRPTTPYEANTTALTIPTASIHKLQAPDIIGSTIRLGGFTDDWSVRSEDDLNRVEMIGAIFDVLQQRLTRVANREQLNADLYAYYGYHSSDRNLGHFVLEASGDTNDLQKATSLLTREWARMAQYGLTQSELDRWREAVLKKEKNNLDSASHLANISVDSLMSGDLLLGQDQYYRFLTDALPTYTPEQSQAIAAEVLTFTPRITLIQNPSAATPTDQQLRDWSHWPNRVAVPLGFKGQQEAWAVIKQPGEISSQETLPSGIEVFTLGNGIEVYYSRYKSDSDRVNVQFVGQGGLNALSDDEAIAARLALGVMAASGLGNLNGEALSNWLKERDITITPYFTYYSRELQLEGSNNNVESLFRLAHTSLTEGQVDEQVLSHQKKNAISFIQQQATGNRDEFDRRVEEVLYQNDARLRRMTEQDVINVSKGDIETIYNRYYSGAQNYKVYIVGDLAPAELRDYLTHYIANISAHSSDYGMTTSYPKLEKSERVIGSGVGGEASFITLMYEVDKDEYPWVNLSLLKGETNQLSEQLTSTIREAQGLTYAVSANFSGGSSLNNTIRMQIDLSVAPDQVDKAIDSVNQQIAMRAYEPVDASEIDRMLLKHRNQFDDAVNSNQRLMLMATAEFFDRPKATLFDARSSVRSYDGSQVNRLYQGLLGEKARHLEFVLTP